MKIFIDTNVIVDLVTGRPGAEEAACIFDLATKPNIILTTSFLSMANIAYIVRKKHTTAQIYEILSHLSEMVEILGMDKAQFEEALTHQASDFEDMLQYICASTNMCDIIITRNIRDFSFSKLPLYTPSQYLSTQH